jgi:AcrR family transcriptional regulator
MGRHREFDPEKALDAAMGVFWDKGYEGASYADLTAAAGVERPALYSAFGNKESLFRLALARYNEEYLSFIPDALAMPTAREVAAHMLYNSADLQTRYPTHTGCLNINGGVAASDEAEPIRLALVQAREAGEVKLRDRFERAQREGDLPPTENPRALAIFLMAVMHGMAIQAKAGFDRATLESVADQALSAWPA